MHARAYADIRTHARLCEDPLREHVRVRVRVRVHVQKQMRVRMWCTKVRGSA